MVTPQAQSILSVENLFAHFNLAISFILLLSLSSCQEYSRDQLIGTWTSKEIAWQFNDSLAIKYEMSIDEFFVYTYELNGDEIKFSLLDSFLDYEEVFTFKISSFNNLKITLSDVNTDVEKEPLSLTKVNSKIPVIYSSGYPYHNEFYYSQLKKSAPNFFPRLIPLK